MGGAQALATDAHKAAVTGDTVAEPAREILAFNENLSGVQSFLQCGRGGVGFLSA